MVSLLMREAALQKRRRAAEELLQWHKKLLEEEKRITELELAANAIISHIPKNVSASTDVEEKYKFKGKQLNQLWFNLTGCEVKKFAEEKIYPMSQIALERFCMSARHYSSKTKKILRKVSDSDINSDYSELKLENSISENIPDQKDILSASIKMEVEQSRKQSSSGNEVIPTVSLNDYASDFDVESIEEIVSEDVDVVDQSINRLIDNFSKIKEDISSLSLKQSWKSGVDPEQNDSQKSEKTDSDIEISVIETNKTSKEDEEKSKSEEVNLKLSEDKISTSNKNSSTIEEIKRSTTKDNTNKSEDVLLRLYKAEEKKSEIIISRRISGI
ncbi:hypothetical protein NQ314_010703 [Rhamnusium bicolor]|uniref:Uncharacterized protein n=1 Tax=Rhamnusium bicolor TaxID=1586634 RepID=A0AAV8XR92_9CUCU|nr:hypothetical protein NQ314_010703 [Rhamnusium bicolor]